MSCRLCVKKKKLESLQGFQQFVAKLSTGWTASTVPAEEKRYSISNVTVNTNLSAVCIWEKRISFYWHRDDNLPWKGHLGGIFQKIGKKFFQWLGVLLQEPAHQTHFLRHPKSVFFISVSEHIRFILQNNADFRMGRKGEVVSLLCSRKKNNKAAAHYCKGTTYRERSWELLTWHMCFSFRYDKTTDILSFIFCSWTTGWRKEWVLVLMMFKSYLESSWTSYSNLSCFIFLSVDS